MYISTLITEELWMVAKWFMNHHNNAVILSDNSCHICGSKLRMKRIRSLICIQITRKADVRFISISKEATTLIFVKEFLLLGSRVPKVVQ